MADPTAAEILAAAKAIGGRTSVIRSEVVRLLAATLPGVIALHNTRESENLTAPARIRYARTNFDKLVFPTIAVGCRVQRISIAPRVTGRVPVLTITVLAEPGASSEQVDEMWDLAELCEMVLKKTAGGWKLPDNRALWISCAAQGLSDQLPDAWKQYTGVHGEWEINQAGLDLWTPA